MPSLTIGRTKFSFASALEFAYQYKDIFLFQEYKFTSKSKSPVIIDCGANIGMSVLYFKKSYPKSKIIAFEPNPKTFKILQKNIDNNHLKNVTLINKALSNNTQTLNLLTKSNKKSSWSDSVHASKFTPDQPPTNTKVKATKLSGYITQPVDLLKIDIEGSEGIVISEISRKLHMIKNIIIEYHGFVGLKNNSLQKITQTLRSNGFSVTFTQGTNRRKPIAQTEINQTKPFYLMIYATRTSS